MNKKFLKLGLGAFLIGSIALTSCETDTEEANDTLEGLTEGCTDLQATNFSVTALVDDGSCEYDNDHLITNGAWNFSAASTTAGASTDSLYNLFMVGMNLDFSDDGTFSGMTPGENGLESATGTWTFMASETMVAIYQDTDTMVFGISELTTEALGFSFTEEDETPNYDVTLNFVH
jgi:hypothetical protein